ncbi:acyl-CoA dehydrogenase family protein [Metapseudomonas resinovorans]|uniref:Putative acyl-CoA dehydrogenase n=1 Tax=Metapseudomonas resinovorans NBRC 106553 TaxID=1245471 RepID=S6AJJ8_METRE|nr:acyl-CoA dehydrogenase family protein [Pseudomonas resinovorans]BAN48680.1 putative acyl-CoA dehydrogenase [Pseudomonas resinovorans NBRC 106553]
MSGFAKRVELEPTGLDADLNELEAAMQASVRRFATRVMRPVGQQLDHMTPGQVIAADSPLWQVFEEFAKLGLNLADLLALPPADRARLICLVFEELGYGDGGLAVVIGASMVPSIVLHQMDRADLLERYADKPIGCWGITEPDHGSDMLDSSGHSRHPGVGHGRLNCHASIVGDRIVINGQKSAWVSNGPIAQLCILFCGFDDGSGQDKRCVVLVPLDAEGVTRGLPLDKMGQRALPQGELYFDNVSLTLDHLVAGPENYVQAEQGVLTEANGLMGVMWTGAARAAYEHAYEYAHQRKQGGVPIIQHQNVRHRLFHMFARIEAARALARRAIYFNEMAPAPALQGSIASKITATQTAFDVASQAIQMFGGNGVTREYPVEKLLRDARASMIEDGCNEMLAIKGGTLISRI